MTVLSFFSHFGWVLGLVFVALAYKLVLRVFGVVIVPENCVGVVNKKFVVFGSNRTLPDGSIVALNGEAGLQADTLAPGVHYFLWPWQYSIDLVKFITIDTATVGVVEARDGSSINEGRVLGRHIDCSSYQDARAFLTQHGERGPQLSIIPPGTYRINTALFNVRNAAVTEIADNEIGIVTTKDGAELPSGEIAGRRVEGHDSFQNAQAFVSAGGSKGRQEQVLLAGRYFINPLFATVERAGMTQVPIANVGVVIAYVGQAGADTSGSGFKHGNLVDRGCRGVWNSALDPGKYPINPCTHKVELVPTANVVLNWADAKTEAHHLDENLSTITVRSSDGFKFNLDVSQIIHIPHDDAPKVIARFGSMQNLVTQVLEPTIGNYFRNAAQASDVIDFLKNRSTRQEQARNAIKAALDEYNVNAVDTLIGDIVPPEELMKTLTDRKLAEQEKVTYSTQKDAEMTRQDLQQARAMADTQATVVAAERQVSIREFQAQAAVKQAEGEANAATTKAGADARILQTMATGEAQKIQLLAQADADRTRITGEAEAGRVRAVGNAEAEVIKKKIDSVESGNYALIETAKALASSGKDLVPQIIAGGNNNGTDGGLVSVLIADLILQQKAKKSAA